MVLYCHSLDVGLAKVHHLMEAQDVNGLTVRVSSRSDLSSTESMNLALLKGLVPTYSLLIDVI